MSGIVIDWMGRNIYWTDEGRGTINIARLMKETRLSKRRLLITAPHPRSIAMDPKCGLMYWSQWDSVVQISVLEINTPATIQRAWIGGSHIEVFVSTRLHSYIGPTDLPSTILGKSCIGQTYCHLSRIERINLDGSAREVKLFFFLKSQFLSFIPNTI